MLILLNCDVLDNIHPTWAKNMGVSKNRGTPKWMVYNGKPHENGWFGGTTIFGNIHMELGEMWSNSTT